MSRQMAKKDRQKLGFLRRLDMHVDAQLAVLRGYERMWLALGLQMPTIEREVQEIYTKLQAELKQPCASMETLARYSLQLEDLQQYTRMPVRIADKDLAQY